MSSCLQTFWVVTPLEEGAPHVQNVEAGGQGCCSTPFHAQDSGRAPNASSAKVGTTVLDSGFSHAPG